MKQHQLWSSQLEILPTITNGDYDALGVFLMTLDLLSEEKIWNNACYLNYSKMSQSTFLYSAVYKALQS